jgi:hypothetical protein
MTDWDIRDDVVPGLGDVCGSREPGFGLRDHDLGGGHDGIAAIFNEAGNLLRILRVCLCHKAEAEHRCRG